MAKYPYVTLPSKEGLVYKPWINVSLGYKKTHKITYPVAALIDSGADVCFCAKDIGIWLGIQFKKKTPFTFNAANRTTFEAFKEAVVLHTSEKTYSCSFYFTSQLPPETPIILGQLGFFDHFKISFDLKNKEIEIT